MGMLHLQSACSQQLDHSMVVYFSHLFSFSQEVLHLLTVMAVPRYEVTHWGEGRGERGGGGGGGGRTGMIEGANLTRHDGLE